jgi:hypothetical protein
MALPSRRFLKPRNSPIRGKATGRTASISAPVGGLNAVDSLAAMPPEDAVVLDNFFPYPTYVQLRAGSADWVTGLPSFVETLMGFSDNTTTEKLFAISGTSVYDVTTSGAVGAAVVTGLSNARWEYVNVSVPGGASLYAANGVDKPLYYDGSSWVKVDGASTPAITGVTTTTLRNPAVWKSRLWFVQNNTTKAWYLPVQSIGGAATSFDLATIWNLGGELQSIITFSLSSATSFDDYIGFLSTEGQLAVYQGTDPASASTFSIVGVYNMGKPVGRRCWFKYGNDAAIICSDGLVSVQRVISVGVKNPKDAITYKIQQLINADIQDYSGNFGWQGVVYPLGNKVILNVPQSSNSQSHQYVMNTLHGAWCSYGLLNSPWNASCFCVLGDNLYWGDNTIVKLGDTGRNDSGTQIFGSMLPAYSYFGTNRQKQFTMLRPILLTSGPVTPALGLSLDFQTKLPTGTPTFSPQAGGIWGTGKWGSAVWGGSARVQKQWQTIYGVGFSASVYLQLAATQADVKVLSFDYVMKDGGVL